MMKHYDSPDEFFKSEERWKRELLRLREIMLSTGLEEALKWSAPNYLHGKKLVVGISGFKDYFGLWFHQGALLKDKEKVLLNAQEGKTRAMRQWRMTNFKEIKARVLKAYVVESISLFEQGVEIKAQRKKPLVVPEELGLMLGRDKKLLRHFAGFSKSRQREFAEYIAEAKRPATKIKRLEKILPMIVEGVGLNDKYRK